MRQRFLRKCEIAAMFGTSPDMAASILKEQGVFPVDFGPGRGKGLRWLESAVNEVMLSLHGQAQPKPGKPARIKPGKIPESSLAEMSNSSIFELVSGSTH